MDISGGRSERSPSSVAEPEARPSLRSAGDDAAARRPPVRALSAVADAIEGLLEPHASLELSELDEIRQAIGDGPSAVLGVRSLAVHPIVWRSKVRGALIIVSTEERAFERVDRELLDAVILMGAPALERAGRYDIDHEIALKLQRGMMSIPPCDAPETPWSAHYSSAATGLVGGDWYDVIDLEDAWDSRSVTSSAVASTRRWRWGKYAARAGRWPTASTSPTSSSTVSTTSLRRPVAVRTPRWHTSRSTDRAVRLPTPLPDILRHSCCFPTAPRSGSTARAARCSGAADRARARRCTSTRAPTIVLYTDGLVERRGEPLDVGLTRLVEAARTVTERKDRARHLVEAIGSEGRIDDDVAVVVVSFLGQLIDDVNRRATRRRR